MLQAIGMEARKPALPCPGLLDDAGAVRDVCRVCGKCDDIIRDMLRDIAPAAVNDQASEPARTPA